MRNNGIRILSGVGSAFLLLLSMGCQSSPHDGRSEGRVLDDKDITKRVESSLKDEPAYKFTSVDVNTFAGIVQLSGFVNTQAQRERAQQLAENVSGVREVVNGITIKPVAQPTGRPKVQRIYSDPQNPPPSAAPVTPAPQQQKSGTDQDNDQK